MFKKPRNRNFRQRARDSESEEEHREQQHQQEQVQQKLSATKLSADIDDDQLDDGIEVLSNVTIKKTVVEKQKSKLSFNDDDEEEGDVFKVKKSSFSRRMAKQFKKDQQKLNQQRKENQGQPADEPKVIKKKEEDVTEKTESVRKRMERERQLQSKEKEELNVVWIKSETIKKEPEIVEIPAEDPYSDESDEDDADGHTFRSALERGVIPDAKTIYALKKQRQQRRDADEFIPVSGQGNESDEDAHLRLGRNGAGDDDDDDEEEEDRIDFVGIEKTDKEKTKEEFYQSDEERGSADEDDELTRWEREQIKKGLGGQQNQDAFGGDPADQATKTAKHLEVPAFITQRSSKPKINLDDICNQLRERLGQSKEELAKLERDLVTSGIETMQAEEERDKLVAEAKHCAREFEFYQIVKNNIASKLPPSTNPFL